MNVWGYWKCPYCGEVVRADHKDCTKCGASVPNDAEFFMDPTKPIEYVDKELENDEANWLCSFCRSQNPAQAEVCENCGALRETAKGVYEVKEPKKEREHEKPNKPKKKRSRLYLMAFLALLLLFIGWLYKPVTREGEITGFEWDRSITVEEYMKSRESDWYVPNGAEVLSSSREIRSYRRVLDHYETKTKKVAKRVQDGYDISYKNLGNGQFKEVKKPKYKTVYEKKTVKEPVYRQEPIYDTKYYFNIDRWKAVDSLFTSGDDQNPKWAETDLPTSVESPKYGDKRQAERKETYRAIIKDDKGNEKKVEYDYEKWKNLKVGDKIEYKTRRFSDDPL